MKVFNCIPDESGGLATFTVWALENDPETQDGEMLSVLGRDDLTDAVSEAHREITENPAAFGALVTEDGTEEIVYAYFRFPERGGIVQHADGSRVTSWRDAEKLLTP